MQVDEYFAALGELSDLSSADENDLASGCWYPSHDEIVCLQFLHLLLAGSSLSMQVYHSITKYSRVGLLLKTESLKREMKLLDLRINKCVTVLLKRTSERTDDCVIYECKDCTELQVDMDGYVVSEDDAMDLQCDSCRRNDEIKQSGICARQVEPSTFA